MSVVFNDTQSKNNIKIGILKEKAAISGTLFQVFGYSLLQGWTLKGTVGYIRDTILFP